MTMATTKTPTTKPKENVTLKRRVRPGYVSHTELASADPNATRAWCEKVMGWQFGEPMPTPDGPYNMWRFDEGSGGGIRKTNPGEPGGTTPYVEVDDIKATHKAALKAGAKEMMPPTEVPGSGGWIAVVNAPGGVPVGFWSPK